MKMVTAIVRTSTVERVMAALKEEGIRGLTISDAKGIGNDVHVYAPYEVHKRIEIIVRDADVAKITSAVVENAHTGFAGDGLIAVAPIDYVIRIRTKEKETQ